MTYALGNVVRALDGELLEEFLQELGCRSSLLVAEGLSARDRHLL